MISNERLLVGNANVALYTQAKQTSRDKTHATMNNVGYAFAQKSKIASFVCSIGNLEQNLTKCVLKRENPQAQQIGTRKPGYR